MVRELLLIKRYTIHFDIHFTSSEEDEKVDISSKVGDIQLSSSDDEVEEKKEDDVTHDDELYLISSDDEVPNHLFFDFAEPPSTVSEVNESSKRHELSIPTNASSVREKYKQEADDELDDDPLILMSSSEEEGDHLFFDFTPPPSELKHNKIFRDQLDRQNYTTSPTIASIVRRDQRLINQESN